jgi:hypothetical protein
MVVIVGKYCTFVIIVVESTVLAEAVMVDGRASMIATPKPDANAAIMTTPRMPAKSPLLICKPYRRLEYLATNNPREKKT